MSTLRSLLAYGSSEESEGEGREGGSPRAGPAGGAQAASPAAPAKAVVGTVHAVVSADGMNTHGPVQGAVGVGVARAHAVNQAVHATGAASTRSPPGGATPSASADAAGGCYGVTAPYPDSTQGAGEAGEAVDDDDAPVVVRTRLRSPAAGSEEAGVLAPAHVRDPAHPRLSRLPLPTTYVSDGVAARFAHFHALSQAGHSFTRALQGKKDFQNPYMMSKVIEHFGIDHIGSAYPPSLFDPHGYPPEAFYEQLDAAQMQASSTSAGAFPAAAQPPQRRGGM